MQKATMHMVVSLNKEGDSNLGPKIEQSSVWGPEKKVHQIL